MAKVIDWNNVSIPSFADSNALIREANQGYANAGELLAKTAQGYQDAIRKRNTGLIQEYINSARTPEELQSEAFQVGYQNLVNTLAKEYDPVAMNQYKDSRGDVLTKRASDALQLERNQFGLEQDRLKAPTELDLLKARLSSTNQEIDLASKLNPYKVADAKDSFIVDSLTQKDRIAKFGLDNQQTKTSMDIARGNLAVAKQNANTQYLKTLAEIQADKDRAEQTRLSKLGEKDKYIQTGFSKLNEVEKNITSGFLKETLNIDPSITFSTWKEKAIDEYNDSDVEDTVEQINKLPNISVKGDAYKIYLAEETLRKKRDRHLLGLHNVWSSDADREKTTYLLNQTVEEYEGRLSNVISENKKPIYLDMITNYARENGTDVYTAAQKIVGNDDDLITSLGIDKPVVEPFVLDPKITLNPIQQTTLNNLRLGGIRAGNLYESNPSRKNGVALSDASQALKDYEVALGFKLPASNSNIVLPNETQRIEQRAFDRLYASGGNINITSEAVQKMLEAERTANTSVAQTTSNNPTGAKEIEKRALRSLIADLETKLSSGELDPVAEVPNYKKELARLKTALNKLNK